MEGNHRLKNRMILLLLRFVKLQLQNKVRMAMIVRSRTKLRKKSRKNDCILLYISYLFINNKIIKMDRHYKDNKFIPVSHKMHNYIRNRGSSVSKLPPIHKIPLLKQSPKQKIKGIDISLDLLHNYSKPRIMSNGSSSRVYKKPSTHAKLRSSRRRTDSIGS